MLSRANYVSKEEVRRCPRTSLKRPTLLAYWTLPISFATYVKPWRNAASTSSGATSRSERTSLTYVGAINDAGLDGEAFVRYGCTHDIAVPLALALALDSWGDGPTPIGQQWVEALGIGSTLATSRHPERTTAIGELATAVFPVVCDWVYQAPFTDIIALTPPSLTTRRAIAENPEPSDDLTADYRWIKDRLSADSLDTWGLSSLTREYKWLRGQSTSLNLPEAVLTENPATAEAVAMEIVDRNVLQGQPMSTLAPMTHQVQKQAKEFLYAERYSEAAALFEFMCAQGWMPETLCHNNRGFCLIPVDPRGGLRFLQRAASRGFSPFAVNTHNQMCCMLALDDPGALRDVAERYWCEHFEDGEAISATLWARKGDRWVLTHTPDARECIATLALDVAQREAWSDRGDCPQFG